MNEDSPGAKSPQRLKERLREETVRTLLAAAEAAFAVQGLSGASMADIAERAGVAVGTLYNHFKDRETLLEAVLVDRKLVLVATIDARMAEVKDQAFPLQLEAVLGAIFAHLEQHRSFLQVVLMTEHRGRANGGEHVRALHDRLERLLDIGQKTGVLRADEEHAFPVMLLGIARALFLRETYGAERLSPQRSVELAVEFFLRGAAR